MCRDSWRWEKKGKGLLKLFQEELAQHPHIHIPQMFQEQQQTGQKTEEKKEQETSSAPVVVKRNVAPMGEDYAALVKEEAERWGSDMSIEAKQEDVEYARHRVMIFQHLFSVLGNPHTDAKSVRIAKTEMQKQASGGH